MSKLKHETKGDEYIVPNFLINDPVFKKDFVENTEDEKMLEVLKLLYNV